jgi:hypothetical protein
LLVRDSSSVWNTESVDAGFGWVLMPL